MKHVVSLTLVVALVMAAGPTFAQQRSMDGRVSYLPGGGPIARAAGAEALRGTLAAVGREAQDARAGLREQARKIPLGKQVKVKSAGGEKTGKLRAVTDECVTIELPAVPRYDTAGNRMSDQASSSVEIPFETMKSIEQKKTSRWVWVGVIGGAAASLLFWQWLEHAE